MSENRRQDLRRRLREYSTRLPDEKLGLGLIASRDGWICGICHEPVERDRRCPDPHSATLDHITPLSRNGEHTAENVRLAHRVCNEREYVEHQRHAPAEEIARVAARLT